MIGGMHTIFYSKDADALRRFFRDVLKLRLWMRDMAGLFSRHRPRCLLFIQPKANVTPIENLVPGEFFLVCSLQATPQARGPHRVDAPLGQC